MREGIFAAAVLAAASLSACGDHHPRFDSDSMQGASVCDARHSHEQNAQAILRDDQRIQSDIEAFKKRSRQTIHAGVLERRGLDDDDLVSFAIRDLRGQERSCTREDEAAADAIRYTSLDPFNPFN